MLESQVDATRLEAVLAVRDSKGRGLLHLAAKNPTSSTAVKLLLDCGVKVTNSLMYYIIRILCQWDADVQYNRNWTKLAYDGLWSLLWDKLKDQLLEASFFRLLIRLFKIREPTFAEYGKLDIFKFNALLKKTGHLEGIIYSCIPHNFFSHVLPNTRSLPFLEKFFQF